MSILRAIKSSLLALSLASTVGLSSAQAESVNVDRYLGEVFMVGFTFCPRGTTEAKGQMMPIRDYQALFSLYGTTYGGDGRTTFALPNLQGSAPIGFGNYTGLPTYYQGAQGIIKSSEGDPQLRSLAMRYCVVLDGFFPARN